MKRNQRIRAFVQTTIEWANVHPNEEILLDMGRFNVIIDRNSIRRDVLCVARSIPLHLRNTEFDFAY